MITDERLIQCLICWLIDQSWSWEWRSVSTASQSSSELHGRQV